MTGKERSKTSTEPAELEPSSEETAALGDSEGKAGAEHAANADANPNSLNETPTLNSELEEAKLAQAAKNAAAEQSISPEAASEWDVAPTRVIPTVRPPTPYPPKHVFDEQPVRRAREPMVTVGRQRQYVEPAEPRIERSTLLGVAPLRTPLPGTTTKRASASATPLPATSARTPASSEETRSRPESTPDSGLLPTRALGTPPPEETSDVRNPVEPDERIASVPPPPLPSIPPPPPPPAPRQRPNDDAALVGAPDLPSPNAPSNPLFSSGPERPSTTPLPFQGRRLWILVAITVPVAAAIGVWLNTLVQKDATPRAPLAQSVAISAPATAVPSPSSASPPPPRTPTAMPEKPPASSEADRAAAGDATAMERLAARPPEDRKIEETLALAKGHRVAKLRELAAFRTKLRQRPDLLDDRNELRRLRDYVNDREIAVEALALVAELPGPIGPDLLYDTWIGNPKRTETTELAQHLVYSEEVRAKASPALAVVLDLRNAKSCEGVLDIVPRANEHGDRRATSSLKKLLVRRGCGKKRLEDCYACLRPLDKDKDAVNVLQALMAVRKRRPPKLQ